MKKIYQIDQNFNKVILEKKNKKLNKKTNLISLAKHLSFSYYIITPIFLGIGVGLILDKFLKTDKLNFKIFFFIGIIGSFYNLWRFVNENLS